MRYFFLLKEQQVNCFAAKGHAYPNLCTLALEEEGQPAPCNAQRFSPEAEHLGQCGGAQLTTSEA